MGLRSFIEGFKRGYNRERNREPEEDADEVTHDEGEGEDVYQHMLDEPVEANSLGLKIKEQDGTVGFWYYPNLDDMNGYYGMEHKGVYFNGRNYKEALEQAVVFFAQKHYNTVGQVIMTTGDRDGRLN